MTASAQSEPQAVFLGSTPASSGFAANVYATTAGRAAYVEVIALMLGTGNVGNAFKTGALVKQVSGAATIVAQNAFVACNGDASSLTVDTTGASVRATCTNASATAASDVAFFVNAWEAA